MRKTIYTTYEIDDVQKLVQKAIKKVGVLTKSDAKEFATKKDLDQFATKKDLDQFATKKDLDQFATKKDLVQYATKSDIVEFKDAVLKEIKDMREEVALVTGYKDQIEDHDYRIERLEKHTKISPVSP